VTPLAPVPEPAALVRNLFKLRVKVTY
jgi:hypothetical protein